jgi:hypothetical protein
MTYRRLLVGRVRPVMAFAALVVIFGSVWSYVEWVAAQRRARLEAAFDPVQRALMEGMLSNPDLSATMPDLGFSRTKFDLRVQAALLMRRLYAAEIEIPGLRANLALTSNEMDTVRRREQATAAELASAKKRIQELQVREAREKTEQTEAAESEVPSLRASLATALNEMDTMRLREQATAAELAAAKSQIEELQTQKARDHKEHRQAAESENAGLRAMDAMRRRKQAADAELGSPKNQIEELRAREAGEKKERPEPSVREAGDGNDGTHTDRLAGPESLRIVLRANKRSERAHMDEQNAQLLRAAFPTLTESLRPTDTAAIVARVQVAANSWLKARGVSLKSLGIPRSHGTCKGYLCADGILGELTKTVLKEISDRDQEFWLRRVSAKMN